MRTKIFKNSLLYAIFLTTSMVFTSLAQTSEISGKVVDGSDNSPLWGTNIMIMGSSNGTTSDVDGKFRLVNLAPGKNVILFRYIGYKTDTLRINLTQGSSRIIEVKLKPDILESKEVVITAQLQGQQSAINQQINSNSIVNIVSKDKIQELPDQNAAETLARLPGISLERSGGEGQKVVIRGLAPKYSNITINGEKIPSTDAVDRSVDLSSISPDMLAGIEVYKSITPDQDGDAVGGTVNFTVKRASNDFHGDAKWQNGYNSLEKYYGNYRGSFSLSDRFFNNLLGVVATANIQRANRSSDAQDVSYSFGSQSANGAVINVDNLNLADTKEIRDRYGASLTTDYDLKNGSILFSGFWSKTSMDELRRRKRYQIANARTQYEIRQSNIDQQLLSTSLEGHHNLGILQVDWHGAYSESDQNTPNEYNNIFQELSSLTNQIVVDQGPQQIPNGVKNNLNNTTFKESDITSYRVKDHSLTAQVDAKINFDYGSNFAGFLKTGGKLRWNRRDRDNNQYWTSSFNLDSVGAIAATNPGLLYRSFYMTTGRKLLMSNFLSPNDIVGEFLNGAYDFGPSLDEGAIDDFINNMRNAKLLSGKSLYIYNPQIALQNYNAKENISAAYIMAQVSFSPRLLFIPGVRYERTYSDYRSITGTPVSGEDVTPNLAGARDTVGARSFDDFLPMFQLKYKVTDWFDIRAAVTKTLSRPDYFNLVPWQQIDYLGNTIQKGNPELKHTTVWNYDLYFSTYNNYGLFTVGGFYKKLWNIDYLRQSRIQDGGTYNGFMLTQPVNAENPSTVYGIEIDLQANLALLPSPFNGIVFGANLSLMKSKTYFPLYEVGPRSPRPPFAPTIIDTVREGSMPGQADYLGNLQVGYEKSGFSGRVSFIFQGKSLSYVGSRPELDGYTDKSVRMDVALQQKIFERTSLYLNFNNLTNVPDKSFLGSEQFPTNEAYYGWSMDLGVKYKF